MFKIIITSVSQLIAHVEQTLLEALTVEFKSNLRYDKELAENNYGADKRLLYKLE